MIKNCRFCKKQLPSNTLIIYQKCKKQLPSNTLIIYQKIGDELIIEHVKTCSFCHERHVVKTGKF